MTGTEFPAIAFFGLKLLVLIGIGVYAVFALVMVQQTKLMVNVLEDAFETVLKTVSLVHLVAAVGLFFLALIIL